MVIECGGRTIQNNGKISPEKAPNDNTILTAYSLPNVFIDARNLVNTECIDGITAFGRQLYGLNTAKFNGADSAIAKKVEKMNDSKTPRPTRADGCVLRGMLQLIKY